MVGQPYEGLERRQAPDAITGLQFVKHLRPVVSVEIEPEGLRPGAVGNRNAAEDRRQVPRRQLVRVREKGSPVTVMHTNQPKHQLTIIGCVEQPVCASDPDRQRFVAPALREAESFQAFCPPPAADFASTVPSSTASHFPP